MRRSLWIIGWMHWEDSLYRVSVPGILTLTDVNRAIISPRWPSLRETLVLRAACPRHISSFPFLACSSSVFASSLNSDQIAFMRWVDVFCCFNYLQKAMHCHCGHHSCRTTRHPSGHGLRARAGHSSRRRCRGKRVRREGGHCRRSHRSFHF